MELRKRNLIVLFLRDIDLRIKNDFYYTALKFESIVGFSLRVFLRKFPLIGKTYCRRETLFIIKLFERIDLLKINNNGKFAIIVYVSEGRGNRKENRVSVDHLLKRI